MSLGTSWKNLSITSETTTHWRTFQFENNLNFSRLKKKKTYTCIRIFWMQWLRYSSRTTKWKTSNSSSKLGDRQLKIDKKMLKKKQNLLNPRKRKQFRSLKCLKSIQNLQTKRYLIIMLIKRIKIRMIQMTKRYQMSQQSALSWMILMLWKIKLQRNSLTD